MDERIAKIAIAELLAIDAHWVRYLRFVQALVSTEEFEEQRRLVADAVIAGSEVLDEVVRQHPHLVPDGMDVPAPRKRKS